MHGTFLGSFIQVFRQDYLRKPTQTDVDCLLQVASDFASMLGSTDYMQ